MRARGQALVETALILPLILFVVLAAIEITLVLNDALVVQEAARAGAAAAAISGGDVAAVEQAVQHTIEAGGTTSLQHVQMVTVTCTPEPCRRYAQIAVTVVYRRAYLTSVLTGAVTRTGFALRLSERDS